MNENPQLIHAAGGGYGPPPGAPPGGYGPPPGAPGGYGQPPGAPMGPPGGMPMAPPGGGMMPGGMPGMHGGGQSEVAKQAGTWFIISIVGILFCCWCWPMHGAGAYFAHQAKGLAAQGDLAGAEAKLKTGKMLSIVGFGIGVVLIILYVVWMFLMGGLAMFT